MSGLYTTRAVYVQDAVKGGTNYQLEKYGGSLVAFHLYDIVFSVLVQCRKYIDTYTDHGKVKWECGAEMFK